MLLGLHVDGGQGRSGIGAEELIVAADHRHVLRNPQPDALQLPQLVFPVATLTVGWPDEEPPLSDRLPLESFVHNEAYHAPTAADIDRFYAAKEALPENQEFVRINKKETLAQVFTDIRYTKKDNEMMSQGFLEALKKQGFITNG
jgi:FMN reductase [NAD(P)H]